MIQYSTHWGAFSMSLLSGALATAAGVVSRLHPVDNWSLYYAVLALCFAAVSTAFLSHGLGMRAGASA